MAKDHKPPAPAEQRMGRAMDLVWAETAPADAPPPPPPAAPAEDTELVAELIPIDEAKPADDGGPFIEAVLVQPGPAPLPSGGSVSDWLNDVEAPAPPPRPPEPPKSATPDWLTDVEGPSAPAAPPTPEPAVSVPPADAPVPTVDVVPVFRPGAGPAVSRFVPYPPRLILGGASSRGRVRERNEDRFQTRHWNWNDADGAHDVALLVVADGMGGHQAGDEAAALTVRTVADRLAPVVGAAMAAKSPEGAALAAALDEALREANRVVYQQSRAEGRCKGMGATAAAVLVWDGRAYFGHVGDCRIYLHRGGDLKQLTEDQTLVARMVALGQLTPEEAAVHESRNEVLQAIGKRATVEPSRGEQVLARGDYLLVACDGLAAHVAAATIREVLNWPAVPAQHLPSQLVTMADEAGGTDNSTVVVAHFA